MDGPVIVHRINKGFAFIGFIRVLKTIKPDIVHIHAPNIFSCQAIPITKLMGIPLLATVHRAEIDRAHKLYHALRKISLRGFDRIVAVSNFSKSLALRAGALPEKVVVIHNSCREEIYHDEDKMYARKKIGVSEGNKIILFVGNLIKLKGVYTLLEAMREIHKKDGNIVALIVGDGEEKENLLSRLKEWNLEDVVSLVGTIKEDELVHYYNAADVFVLPSLVEGQSVALLEAMACGLPIIASKIGGNIESITDQINGILYEGDGQILAKNICYLLNNEHLRLRMSMDCLRIYHSNFSQKYQLAKYLKLYKELTYDNDSCVDTHKKLILFDAPGLSHYTSYLACGLSRYYEVVLYGFSRDKFEIVANGKQENIRFIEIKSNTSPTKTTYLDLIVRPIRVFWLLCRVLVFQNYDLVHFQGHLPMMFLFLPVVRMKKKRIFWTIHDVSLRPSSPGRRGRFEIIYLRLVSQPSILSHHVDGIFVHGRFLKEQLIATGSRQEMICVIPHFDYDYLLRFSNIRNEDLLLPDQYALSFGHIKPYKGLDILINAARIVNQTIPNFKLLIAGNGNISYINSLVTCRDLGFIDLKIGYVHDRNIPLLFTKASFVVLPYTDGSQSGVLSLAYTFSKPVIASKVGSLPEYIEHGTTGYIFQSRDETKLAQYMIELLQDQTKCKEMGKRARQKLSQQMSVQKCCQLISDFYDRY